MTPQLLSLVHYAELGTLPELYENEENHHYFKSECSLCPEFHIFTSCRSHLVLIAKLFY